GIRRRQQGVEFGIGHPALRQLAVAAPELVKRPGGSSFGDHQQRIAATGLDERALDKGPGVGQQWDQSASRESGVAGSGWASAAGGRAGGSRRSSSPDSVLRSNAGSGGMPTSLVSQVESGGRFACAARM